MRPIGKAVLCLSIALGAGCDWNPPAEPYAGARCGAKDFCPPGYGCTDAGVCEPTGSASGGQTTGVQTTSAATGQQSGGFGTGGLGFTTGGFIGGIIGGLLSGGFESATSSGGRSTAGGSGPSSTAGGRTGSTGGGSRTSSASSSATTNSGTSATTGDASTTAGGTGTGTATGGTSTTTGGTCGVEDAGVYYLSPQGSDGNPGSGPGCPWLTFDHALSQLGPGNALLLLDGTYDPISSGNLLIDCQVNASSGQPGAPISLAAVDERQAVIERGNAQNNILLQNCSYWTLAGLTTSFGDDPTAVGGQNISVQSSDHITVRRMALSHTNRWDVSSTALKFGESTQCVAEENEIYDFASSGLFAYDCTQLDVRRNYANGRFQLTLDGGHEPGYVNIAFNFNDCAQLIVENDVAEGAATGFWDSNDVNSAGAGNSFLGDMAIIDSTYGGNAFVVQSTCGAQGGTGDPCSSPGEVFAADVALGAPVGFNLNDAVGTLFVNDNAIGSTVGFQLYHDPQANPDLSPSCTLLDDVAIQAHDAYNIEGAGLPSYCDSYEDASLGAATDATDVSLPLNPNNCKVYLAAGSDLLALGVDGGPIGASVVYRYDAGFLTGVPLWSTSGEFTCGAIVPGLNDTDAGDCSDVNVRLFVGVPSCPVP